MLLVMMGMIGFMSYANETTTEKMTDVETIIKETLKEVKGLSADVNITFFDELIAKKYRIRVDCDGNGTWDYIYEGSLDESNVDAMVGQLVASC